MKNNLLKSVAAAATASALLFSTVTSFADTTPSATTVTTYSKGTVSVNSTISGVAAGTMVTYLASKKADGTVENSNDILYIGQKTSDGNAITFNYNLPKSVTPTAGNVLAKVKYGANNETTARELNKDISTEVKYGELTIVKNNCDITINGVKLTDNTKPAIGNGDTVEVGIAPVSGYEIKEVSLDTFEKDDAVATGSLSVKCDGTNKELVVICGAVSREATETAVVSVRDIDETVTKNEKTYYHKGVVCSKFLPAGTENVIFGMYVRSANGDGTTYSMGDIKDGFYAEGENQADTDASYYAVQLETDTEITGYNFYPAFMVNNEIKYFDGSKLVSIAQ